MHTLFEIVKRVLFRDRASEKHIASCRDLGDVHLSHISRTPFHIYSLGRYDTALWHALITEIKFHRNTHAIALLAPHVKTALEHFLSQQERLIIPIPLHPSKERARGFNQVTEVLQTACSDAPTLVQHIHTDMLYKIKRTKEQKKLSREKRVDNIKKSFAVYGSLAGQHILLVDDVCATGSTACEAGRACMAAGAASVQILAFCSS
jgi:ComF family protein